MVPTRFQVAVQDVAGVEVRHAAGRAQRQVHDVAPAQLQARRVQQPIQRPCTVTRSGTICMCNCKGGRAKRVKQLLVVEQEYGGQAEQPQITTRGTAYARCNHVFGTYHTSDANEDCRVKPTCCSVAHAAHDSPAQYAGPIHMS